MSVQVTTDDHPKPMPKDDGVAVTSLNSRAGLPLELLLKFFAKGCFLENHMLASPSFHERKRKKFSSLARSVCTRWRYLLDCWEERGAFSQWFAYTGFGFAFWQDLDELEERPNVPVNQLMRLRDVLRNSQGCDLVIRFEFDNGEPEAEMSVINNQEPTPLLKLLLHGVRAIGPHMNQIVHMAIITTQPQALKYVLELLDRFGSSARLNTLEIVSELGRSPAYTLRQVLNATPVLGFDIPLTQVGKRKPTTTMYRLPCLNTLRLSAATWLEEMDIPFGISECSLNWELIHPSDHPIISFQRVLRHTHPNICNTLTVLQLEFELLQTSEDNETSICKSEQQKPDRITTMTFSSLHTLKLSQPPTSCPHIDFFLFFVTPRLASVELTLHSSDDPHREVPLCLTQQHFERLMSLKILTRNISFITAVLELFKSSTKALTTLELFISGASDDFNEGSELTRNLATKLKWFHPQVLSVTCQDSDFLHYMFQNLDTHQLKELKVNLDDERTTSPLPRMLATPPLPIVGTGSYSCDVIELGTLLQHYHLISMPSVQHLSILLFGLRNPVSLHAYPTLCPNVETIELQIRVTTWEVDDTGPKKPDASSSADVVNYGCPRKVDDVLSTLLKPSDLGIPFPRLRFLEVEFRGEAGIDEAQMNHIRGKVVNLCASRLEADSLNLHLQEFYEYNEIEMQLLYLTLEASH